MDVVVVVVVGIGDEVSMNSTGDVVVDGCGVGGGVDDSGVVVSGKPMVVCFTDGVTSVTVLSSKISNFVLFSIVTSIGSIGTGTSGSTLLSATGFISVLSAGFMFAVVDSVEIFAIGEKSPLGLSMTEIVDFSSLTVVADGSVEVVNVGCASLLLSGSSGWLSASKLWNVVGSTEIWVVTSPFSFTESANGVLVISSLGLGPNVVDMAVEVSAGNSAVAVVDAEIVAFSTSPKDTSSSDKNMQCASSSPPRQST